MERRIVPQHDGKHYIANLIRKCQSRASIVGIHVKLSTSLNLNNHYYISLTLIINLLGCGGMEHWPPELHPGSY